MLSFVRKLMGLQNPAANNVSLEIEKQTTVHTQTPTTKNRSLDMKKIFNRWPRKYWPCLQKYTP